MKRKVLSITSVFFFVLAVLLIVIGIHFGARSVLVLEQLSRSGQTQRDILDSVKDTALYAMSFGGMAVTGIGILVILVLHLFRKNSRVQREADAYRARSEAMEELNRQTRTLAHHQRLELLGTLTSSIAHEFNNLLTPIMGYSLMTLEMLPPEQTEIYDNILEVYNCSRQAKTIISRLSDLSRKNSDAVFRPVSPDEVIQKTLDVALPAKPKPVQIKLDLNCQEQRIQANEVQLSQLFLNLIINAFQAMEAGAGELNIKTYFDERNVYVQIADTGCGIPEENLEKIYAPFFTTKDQGKGTGLGLAIAAQVVDDHRGSIHADSTEGKGTVFTVRLPRI